MSHAHHSLIKQTTIHQHASKSNNNHIKRVKKKQLTSNPSAIPTKNSFFLLIQPVLQFWFIYLFLKKKKTVANLFNQNYLSLPFACRLCMRNYCYYFAFLWYCFFFKFHNQLLLFIFSLALTNALHSDLKKKKCFYTFSEVILFTGIIG